MEISHEENILFSVGMEFDQGLYIYNGKRYSIIIQTNIKEKAIDIINMLGESNKLHLFITEIKNIVYKIIVDENIIKQCNENKLPHYV